MGIVVGVTDFAKEILPAFITSDPWFWSVLVKTKVENVQVNLANYNEGLQVEQKKRKSTTLIEVDYRYIAKFLLEYPEIDITDELWAGARKAFPAFQ